MGQAREVMDRLTTAMTAKDKETLANCYSADAVAFTPDEGELTGRDAITKYFFKFWEAIPDVRYEYTDKHEAGEVAIDEGFVAGTNTGPLSLPTGESLPASGKELRVRSCDVARVEGGEITSHHFYFDQLEFLGQLGLLPESLSKH
ncbi:nuclear transport factor 2 family protein [Pseudarthrobacter sp. NIBRBAC000502772]|uniref:nuclear transport factor 2 family protein n=1 Tax=Pseudarthrobacter sp. NIBRBAC000502772 TaxID=2590775 RepID=UPI0011307E84|nr:nuclear transport factor 2 family protein [Pseudarthrobacter sp. NIBRBAC000502772]QDG66028.1 nuclear transport factor 2 family protein [Pseudarthrobacter sp. NIBRBAC000502772]